MFWGVFGVSVHELSVIIYDICASILLILFTNVHLAFDNSTRYYYPGNLGMICHVDVSVGLL
jgi:hypothetical protein